MAINHISIDRTEQLGADLINLARQLQDTRDKANRLVDIANTQWDTGVFTTLESRFGLEAGAGGDVLFLLSYLDEILNTNTTVSGADRLARINDFCARLGQ
jgi:hypothetical protein